MKIKFDVVRTMIKIPIGNGINIVAEQGTDSSFPREIYILSDGENDGADYISEGANAVNAEWIYVGTHEVMGQGFDEYVNADHTLGKEVWFDGYEEIYELA